MLGERTARAGAAISHLVGWLAVGSACSHVRAADGLISPVNQESIVVSLPIFIAAMISTAGFTWVVAKWDTRRSNEVAELRKEMTALRMQLADRVPR